MTKAATSKKGGRDLTSVGPAPVVPENKLVSTDQRPVVEQSRKLAKHATGSEHSGFMTKLISDTAAAVSFATIKGHDNHVAMAVEAAMEAMIALEREMSMAAIRASRAMLTEAQWQTAIERNVAMIVPVRRHMASVQLVGLVRLRYRAKTRATNARFDAAAWAETVKCFVEMERGARSETSPDVDINCSSTEDQRLFN